MVHSFSFSLGYITTIGNYFFKPINLHINEMATSNYPATLDTNITIPNVNAFGYTIGSAYNLLVSAVLNIESALGVNPAGTYGTVAARLSALEGFLNGLQIISLAQDLGGTYSNPLVVGLQGFPISAMTPTSGYVLTWNGASWIPAPPTGGGGGGNFMAGGDLAGSGTVQTVVGLHGRTLAATAPATDQVLEWNGSAWTPTNLPSSLPPSGSATGDLSGTYPSPTVSKLQGNAVAAGTLGSGNDGNVLMWINNDTDWEPQPIISTSRTTNNNITIGSSHASIYAGFLGLTANKIGTLPATPISGQIITFKDKDGSLANYTFTINGNGNTIDGNSSFVMANMNVGPYGSISLYFDGTNWSII